MPTNNRIMPMSHQIVVAAYEGILGYELAFTTEVFGLDRTGVSTNYTFRTCAVEEGPLHSTHGHRIHTNASIEDLTTADTVLVPGWRDINEPTTARMQESLQEAHHNGARIVGICSGVFPLADAGLLNTQTVTTHWLYIDTLRSRHPHLDVDPSPLYIIGNNRTATSAGSSAGLDLCLALVAADYGMDAATKVANRMVVTYHRPGTQTQFVPHDWTTTNNTEDGPLGALLPWIDANLGRPLSIDHLAEQLSVSRRTLIRRFARTTGTTPRAWVVQRRTAEVRRLLETTDLAIKTIAYQTGIGTPDNLRKHLMKSTGLSPSQYRRLHRQGVDQ